LVPDAGLAERRLIQRLQRGENEAFVLLYEQYRLPLIRFCQAMLGSREEAEDAVQHTFMAAYRSFERDFQPDVPKSWLYAIARNRCLATLRTRRGPAPGLVLHAADPAEQLELRESLDELVGDMAELPDVQRTALVLSEVSDLSHSEIAEIIGCERQQVKSLVFRARSALRETRSARQMPCETIRAELSTLRGGSLRRSHLRRHLKTCESCAEFRQQLRRERAGIAAIGPLAPWLALRRLLRRSSAKTKAGGGGVTSAPAAVVGEWTAAKLALLALGVGTVAGGAALITADGPSRVATEGHTARATVERGGGLPLVEPEVLAGENVPELASSPELAAGQLNGPGSGPVAGVLQDGGTGAGPGSPMGDNGTPRSDAEAPGGNPVTPGPDARPLLGDLQPAPAPQPSLPPPSSSPPTASSPPASNPHKPKRLKKPKKAKKPKLGHGKKPKHRARGSRPASKAKASPKRPRKRAAGR
jgi:RNA polymerase sigma factor (sigma-70 family)